MSSADTEQMDIVYVGCTQTHTGSSGRWCRHGVLPLARRLGSQEALAQAVVPPEDLSKPVTTVSPELTLCCRYVRNASRCSHKLQAITTEPVLSFVQYDQRRCHL